MSYDEAGYQHIISGEFAIAVQIAGRKTTGIFDETYLAIDPGTEAAQVITQPRVLIYGEKPQEGDNIIINPSSPDPKRYTASSHIESDGQGGYLVYLEDAH